MPMHAMPMPYAITRRDDGLLIEWEAAGHQALYPARAPCVWPAAARSAPRR